MNQTYLDTALLLTQVAPLVFVDDTFSQIVQVRGYGSWILRSCHE